MRLLAHGGTSYSERHRIGAWPAIPREVLEGTYGLPGDSKTYGLGILDDCLPFLILRVRQTTNIGRAYAYSLLLDPGREVWEHFGWNAADLLGAILSSSIGETLLSQPETLKAEDLVREFSQLKVAAADLATDNTPPASAEQRSCWIGAIFSGESAVLTPAALGFDERPRPDILARLLRSIPQPCFRAGAGWLIGGSRTQGESLGARLILDDGTDVGTAGAPCAERGAQASHAWAVISSHPEFRKVLHGLEVVPLCEWEHTAGVGGNEVLARLQLLSQMVQSANQPDELFATIEQQLSRFPFLATEIRRAAHTLLLGSGQSLSATQTALILRNCFGQGLEIEPPDVARLDPETLTRMVVEHEAQSAGLPKSLFLPPAIAAEVFVRRLGSIPEYRDVPPLLSEAAEFVGRNFGHGTRGETWLTKLFDAVERRTETTTESLQVWDSFPRDSLWRMVSQLLQKAVRNRAKVRSPDWEFEYLCFGQDPGGAQLARAGIDTVAASGLVSCYLSEVRDPDLGPAAKEWLDNLAASPLRLIINIADKLALARSGFSERWLPFRALWAAYSDEPESAEELAPVFASKIRNPSQHAFLSQELNQMLREFPPRSQFPDLRRVQQLLGIVPSDFLAELTKPQQSLPSGAAFARWIESLRSIGNLELASKQVVRFCLDTREPLPSDWLFRGFDEGTLEALADRLLFRGLSADDPFYSTRCEEILSSLNHLPRLRKIFAGVFKTGQKDRVSLEDFIRRYRGHESPLIRLFACFSVGLRDYVIGQLAFHDTDAFIKETREIIAEVESGVPLNNYRYALLRHLRAGDPELRKKIVRWTLHTRTGLEMWLDGVLEGYDERSDEELTGDLSDGEVRSRDGEPSLAAGESLMAAARSSETTSEVQAPRNDIEQKEESLSAGRSGLGGKMRSLLRNVLYEEPPPLLSEDTDSVSTAKKDDSG